MAQDVTGGGGARGCSVESDRRQRYVYWGKFAVIYTAGVLAASSIGKIGPIAGALESDLGLSLDQVGLVASSVTTTAAVLGLVVGVLTRRLTKKPLLVGGLLVMALAGLIVSRASDFGPLLLARFAESVGYVLVVVAAPVLVMSLGDGPRQTAALAVWGTFLPVGLALGSFAGGVLSSVWDARGWLTLAATGTAVIMVVAWCTVPGGRPAAEGGRDRRERVDPAALRRFARPLALACGFATASATIVAMVTLLPSYLTQELGMPAARAGTLTGMVSFIGVAGGFYTSWLVRRGTPVARVFLAEVLMPVGTLIAFAQIGGTTVALFGAIIVALANEMVVAAVFAAVPLVARTADDVSTSSGLIAQLGSLGSLGGPPLAGLITVAFGGWWMIGMFTLVLCLVGFMLLRWSVRPGRGDRLQSGR